MDVSRDYADVIVTHNTLISTNVRDENFFVTRKKNEGYPTDRKIGYCIQLYTVIFQYPYPQSIFGPGPNAVDVDRSGLCCPIASLYPVSPTVMNVNTTSLVHPCPPYRLKTLEEPSCLPLVQTPCGKRRMEEILRPHSEGIPYWGPSDCGQASACSRQNEWRPRLESQCESTVLPLQGR